MSTYVTEQKMMEQGASVFGRIATLLYSVVCYLIFSPRSSGFWGVDYWQPYCLPAW